MILQGWVPATRNEDLVRFLDSTFTFYLSSKPGPEDKVPVLLRNSSFAKLFEPIGKLFSLPAYNEIDLTPFFAPFFMMFFGFCMADAGYGLVIFLGSTVLKLTQGRKNHALFSIVQLFGLSTMFFGLLFGTFFGVSLLEIESLGEVRKYILNNKQIFTLSIMVGLFQILFGTGIRAVNLIKQSGFVYGLPSIGWIFLILGLMDLLFLKAGGIISQIVIYSGIFLIVFFSNPKAGILGRIGKGIWDLYGVTGIFGDALSYVRLFALGASSSILGFVINDIAFKIKDVHPVFGWIICIIFLVLGHTLNMAISALGSFVHPMRLTFVEFYRNAGFAGGGKSYKPFSTKH
jgi:V/A-type H+-transporting ATPase subunit I